MQHNIKSVWFQLHFRTTIFKDMVSTKHFKFHDFPLKSWFSKEIANRHCSGQIKNFMCK